MNLREGFTTKIAILRQANWLQVMLVVITAALLGLYVWQVNISATRGYTMRTIQKEIEQLKIDREQLNMQVAKLQSVDSVTTRMQMLGLVKLENVKYVNSDSSVALR